MIVRPPTKPVFSSLPPPHGAHGGWCVLAGCLLLSLACAGAAAADGNLLANPNFSEVRKGTPLEWLVHDQTHEAVVQISEDPKTGVGKILTFQVTKRSDRPWDVQLRQAMDQPLAKGTNLQVTFEYKISADYWFTCYVQQEGGAWQKYIELRVGTPAGKWAPCRFTCRIPRNIPAGESSLCFHLAAVEGTVSFRDMAVRVLPDGMDADTVSESEALVVGGDAVDRQWRREATSRLMRERRGELTVRVLDANGAPVDGANIRIVQTGPLVPLGAVVPIEVIDPDIEITSLRRPDVPREQLEACRQIVMDSGFFSRVMFPDVLTWSVFEHQESGRLRKPLAELARQGISVHGHALYTPAFRFAPRRFRQMETAVLSPSVLEHVRTQSSALGELVPLWTVVDSPLTYHEMYDLTGEEVLTGTFEAAREAVPKARLFLGEDKALTSPTEERLNDFIGMIRWFQDSGAPVDGLAIQVAAGRPYLAPKALESRLDRIFEFIDMPLVVTGLDVDAPTEETQAVRMADMLLLFASRPEVEAIYLGEFWAPYATRPGNALLDAQLEPRPAFETARRLVTERWDTNVEGRSDADGTVRVVGFTAPYKITVQHGDALVEQTCELEKSGTEITIRLPAE